VFIGHYAVALAAKHAAPRTSLGTLFAAAQLADLLWPVLLLLGWERASVTTGPNPFLTLSLDSIPISHSLVTLVGWGILFAFLYQARSGYARGAVVVALTVVSHWLLDFVTHRPDMPLYPGSSLFGLGLWRSVPGTIIVEVVMFAAGMWLYGGVTRARDGIGRYGYAGLLGVLVLSYVSSLFSPPPSVVAMELGGIVFGWLFVVWAAWVDGHRENTLHDGTTARSPT
jgi:membrane-bound metal-dependent hydrolase YbcI (DUF457 family)